MILNDLQYALPGCDSAAAVDLSSADATLAPACRRLYVGVTGDVTVSLEKSGTIITFRNVPVGYLDVRATKVYKTGTSASQIVALW